MAETALQYGTYYHIYNRGTNGEVLFIHEKYYAEFLTLYKEYIVPVADTLAYCLMSNHFHLLIRVKNDDEIRTFDELKMFTKNDANHDPLKKPVPSNQFQHLFLTYTKKINSAYIRTGSLFEHPFERRIIENENYLKECIVYIHNNPVKDGYAVSAAEYKWSSYNAIISDKPTLIKREHVLNLFGDLEKFHYFYGVFEKNV